MASYQRRPATVPMPYEGWVWPNNYRFDYVEEGYEPPRAEPSASVHNLQQTSHPWLRFTDAQPEERQSYLNRLEQIEDYTLVQPKIMDWGIIRNADLMSWFEARFRTSYLDEVTGAIYELPMWQRIFELGKPIRREWCQEFFSTLRVGKLPIDEVFHQRIIHFRLGGRQRHCTVPEFGYLCGMFQRDEMREGVVHNFLERGVVDLTYFEDGVQFRDYWFEISGRPNFSSGRSKVSEIRSKRLRLLHKMITYSFVHRGNQNDKVIRDDLWLLRQFDQMGADRYGCAPYILARHMERHQERRYLCGHFVTSIMERLGGDRLTIAQSVTQVLPILLIDRTELRKSGLMGATDMSLRDDEDEPAAQRQRVDPQPQPEPEPQHHQYPDFPSSSSFNMTGMRGAVDELIGNTRDIRESVDMLFDWQRTMGTQVTRMGYQLEYIMPHVNQWIQDTRPPPPSAPTYNPPGIFLPANTTYGFMWPPPDQAGPSYRGESSSRVGTSQGDVPQFGSYRHSSGQRYQGHTFDFYRSDFFGTQPRDPDAGDGEPSAFDVDED